MEPMKLMVEALERTSAEIRAVRSEMREEIQALRAEMREEIQALRAEVQEVRRQVSGDGLTGRVSAAETRLNILFWLLATTAGGVILYIVNSIMRIL